MTKHPQVTAFRAKVTPPYFSHNTLVQCMGRREYWMESSPSGRECCVVAPKWEPRT
jgi:hypothetical protein